MDFSLDVLSIFLYQSSIKDALLALLKTGNLELMMHLKLMMMLPFESAREEADFEFRGGLDYEEIAILSEESEASWNEGLKLWAWRLQSEVLLSTITVSHLTPWKPHPLCLTTQFLAALASSNAIDLFASDECILQVLVDLTTGKKLVDLMHGDKCVLNRWPDG